MNPVNINTNEMNNFMGFLETADVNNYISKIRKFEPLTREEEIRLTDEIRNGNEKAYNTFVEHNLLLVVKVARKYMHLGVPLADLIQAGNIGLLTAVHNYAFEIGVKDGRNYKVNKFNSLAVWYIRKEIVDSIEEEGSLIRRPHMVNNTSLKINKVVETLDHEPTIEELSELINESVADVQTAIHTSSTTVSTNVTMDDDNSDHSETFGDMLEGNMYADDEVRKEDTHTEVEILMSSLNERERLVVKMTYGIGYDYERDTNGIANELGVSITTVRNILKSATDKMQKMAASI